MVGNRSRRLCPECQKPAPNVTALGDCEEIWICGEEICSVREFVISGVKTRKPPKDFIHQETPTSRARSA
jgi:hypothetical protein